MDVNPNDSVNYYAIIVAGGTGSRMGADVPKQFLPVNGLPILMHTLLAFVKSQTNPRLVLVLNKGFHDYWATLCKTYNFTIPHTLLAGGETRFHSVKLGLDSIPQEGVIAVHDAVRPLVSKAAIDEAYAHAQAHGTAVVAVPSRDSIRRVTAGHTEALLRDEIYLVQTPQTFQSGLLRRAYQQPYEARFTDDASVVEALGINIDVIEGNYTNIKITFPEDIAIAETLLQNQASI